MAGYPDVTVTLAGAPVRVRWGSVSVRDVLNDAPNTCSLRVDTATPPTNAQRIVITLLPTAITSVVLFDGTLQTINESWEGKPARRVFDCTAQDDTPRANRHIPLKYFENTSATTVAQWLVTNCAPGFTSTHVQASLPNITVLFDGSETGVNGCLRQVAKLIGGYFYWESRDLHLFTSEATAQPDDIDATPGRFFADPRLVVTWDDSQLRTRVYGKGHPEPTVGDVNTGDSIVSVRDASMYNPAGGKVIAIEQILAYTGLQLGNGGGLVGPGAAPSNALTAALAAGTGVETGNHDYASTYTTSSGESIASPRTTIAVGPISAPASAPNPSSVSSGGNVTAGSHDYEVTFGTAAGGETLPSAVSGAVTTGGAAASPPATAPTAGTPTDGGAVTVGAHYYAVTFTAASGETAAGPNSGTITTSNISAPGSAPTVAKASGSGVDSGAHTYGVTFVNSVGETTIGTTSASVTTGATTAPSAAPAGDDDVTAAGNLVAGNGQAYKYKTTFVTPAGETTPSSASADATIAAVSNSSGAVASWSGTTGGSLPGSWGGYYWYSFVDAAGETTIAALHGGAVNIGAGDSAVAFTSVPTSPDPRVTNRRIYRSSNGGFAPYKLVTTLDNSSTSFTDGITDAARGADSPVSNTSGSGKMTVNNLQVSGDASVTSRKLYRTVIGGSVYKLVTTISNNTATSYLDNVADGSLGADAPSSNTSIYNQVSLTAIPTGPTGTTSRKVYRNSAGAGMKLLTTLANNSTTTYTDSTANASLGAAAPGSNTALIGTVPLTSIPTGPAGTTARNIYRTAAGGSQLKFLATIANNSTTTYSDVIADGSLGANAPSGATLNTVNLTAIPTSPSAAVTLRKLYRRFNGSGTFKFVATLSDNTTTTYTDTLANGSLGGNAPSSNTATANRVSLTAIPIGGATVTGRKIYRTTAGGTQLKLLTTIADNTTTTYTDSTADASLGANVPTSDTSLLVQPPGQINAGATTLIVASSAAFSATGGWAIIGNGQQVIRYTGVTGSALTGIPATGIGAITASVGYNSTVTASPALTGVTGLIRPLIKGTPVNIWVQRDDTAAQSELATRESTPGDTTDGVIEHRIVDERRGEASLIALCDADLAQFSRPLATVRYACPDVKTKSGKPVVFNLTTPLISRTLTIQDVTITNIRPGRLPRFAATASSVRFSVEDLLRRMAGTLEGV